jgi:translation initiation factor 3 subunit A
MEAHEEGRRLQAAKEIIVAWRKFRWEIYRAVIELLSKNQKFQDLYHSTCKAAFNLCKEYQRHREFRFLSETLTKHLKDLEKQQSTTKQKFHFEWTARNIRLHLDTRCAQLRVAIELELWNEAYRIRQDIGRILSKDACALDIIPGILAEYELLLSRLFWASEDYLFHACALYKHYTLLRDLMVQKKKRDVFAKLRPLASAVLLACLCIPRADDTDVEKTPEQTEQLEYAAQVLCFTIKPTRKALLAELAGGELMSGVYPELSNLYNVLEVGFHPLRLVKEVKPALDFVRASTEDRLATYAPVLERTVVLRMITQISTVYSALRLQFVQQLLSPLSMSFCEVEKLLVNAVADGQLKLKLDHRKNCIRFVEGSTAGQSAYGQLHRVAQKLQRAAIMLEQRDDGAIEEARKRFVHTMIGAATEERMLVVERMELIEKRKETLRRHEERRRENERILKEQEEKRRKLDEEERLKRVCNHGRVAAINS